MSEVSGISRGDGCSFCLWRGHRGGGEIMLTYAFLKPPRCTISAGPKELKQDLLLSQDLICLPGARPSLCSGKCDCILKEWRLQKCSHHIKPTHWFLPTWKGLFQTAAGILKVVPICYSYSKNTEHLLSARQCSSYQRQNSEHNRPNSIYFLATYIVVVWNGW